jgi:hypothetical protein
MLIFSDLPLFFGTLAALYNADGGMTTGQPRTFAGITGNCGVSMAGHDRRQWNMQ